MVRRESPISLRLNRRRADRESGNVAIIVALLMIPLISVVGLAIDSLRAFIVEDQLQKSLDAAALAVGRLTEDTNIDAEAQQIFDANFATARQAADVGDLDLAVTDNGGRITLSAGASLPTLFMRVIGTDLIPISAMTIINREVHQMELALVMDNTGSMVGQPIKDEIEGAKSLVENVYGGEETQPNLLAALVPYTATVNIGPSHKEWLAATDQVYNTPDPFALSVNKWKGCVMARPNPYDRSEDPPSVKRFNSFLYPEDLDNVWTLPLKEQVTDGNNGTGPNLGCGSPPILSLTPEKSKIIEQINKMGAWHRGGTTSNLGLVWGWRVLSPKWRGLWGGNTPAERPLEYNNALSDKVIVLLTDGNNEVYDHKDASKGHYEGPRGSDFTAYGRLYDMLDDNGNATITSISKGNDLLDSRMASLCQDIKQTGIIIYTITYGSKPDTQTKQLFEKCATVPAYYFHAPDGATMKSVFKKVGRHLSSLRIAY